jgi:chondroitin AC lyase
MKKNKKTLLVVAFMILFTANINADGIDIMRKKITHAIMNQGIVNDANVEILITTFIVQDSIWPGINYQDVSRTAFEHRFHSENISTIAKAYKTESSKWYKNKELKTIFNIALDYWIDRDFICANWWHNEIGTPSHMVEIMYIMDNDLSEKQMLGVQKLAAKAHVNAWGARQSGDRIKIAILEAKQHIFKRDIKKTKEILEIIGDEIVVKNRKRCIQADNSFHHRVDRVNNTLSYGLSYINSFADWVTIVNGTEFEFQQEKLKIAIDYYLDGVCKQMINGRFHDTNTNNRDIARLARETVMGVTTLESFMAASSYRKDELENIIRARTGKKYHISSFAKFFWETEHFSFQRPTFFTSVRMYSTRNANMEEPYNSEGILNHYRGDGANYLSINRSEYKEITPYNDWHKIPGTTVLQSEQMPGEEDIQKYNKSSFVGGVSGGVYGAATFDFISPISGITAKKSWFFFDEEYVCLGADINSKSEQNLATTINQVALNGDVTIKADSEPIKQESNTCSNEAKLKWVYHNNVGYYFPQTQDVKVSNQQQVGSWRLVSVQTTSPKGEVKGDVFKMWIDHGTNATEESYSYVVIPNITLKNMERNKLDNINIIRNDADIQAVQHNTLNILYVVFYKQSELKLDNKNAISVDQPCIVMVKYNKKGEVVSISAADPNRDKRSVILCTTTNKSSDTHIIDFPQGDFSGSTVTVKL